MALTFREKAMVMVLAIDAITKTGVDCASDVLPGVYAKLLETLSEGEEQVLSKEEDAVGDPEAITDFFLEAQRIFRHASLRPKPPDQSECSESCCSLGTGTQAPSKAGDPDD